MFPISAAQQAVLNAGKYAPRVRVAVKDNGGTYRYLTGDLGGWDFVQSVSYTQNMDDPAITFELSLKREVYQWSLAPLMQGSPANLTTWLTPGSGYTPFLDVGRKIKVEAAIVPFGAQPAAADWFLCFEGYIDTIDPGDGWNVHITGRDLVAAIQDTYIENERVYGLATTSTKGPLIWSPASNFAVGDQCFPTNLNGFFYQVSSITTGISGTTEPVWPTSGSVVDGGVTWVEQGTAVYPGTGVAVESIMQQILTDNGTGVSLTTPTSPSWAVVCFKQQRQQVLEGVRALAQQIGWDVRYLYGTGAGVLTFYQPLRSPSSAQAVFKPSQVLSVRKCSLDIQGIRNVVRVVYSNSSVLDANGYPTRALINVQDNVSIARFGRRFMEIAEDSTSKIDTPAEATTMATACLNDLSSPLAEYEAELLYFPFAELGDYYTFKADALHFDVDESFGVFQIKHELTKEKQETTLTLRGKPCSGYKSWHDISIAPNYDNPSGILPSHGLQPFDGGASLTATPTLTGIGLACTFNKTKQSDWAGFEYHLSQNSGFTPSSSTLYAAGMMESVPLLGLDPTKLYYFTVVPYKRNGAKLIRGQPLPIQSLNPQTLRPQHLLVDTSWLDQPPNADFGSFLNGAGNPPDRWSMVAGTWLTDVNQETSVVFDGLNSLRFNSLTLTEIQSDYFPIKGLTDYFLDYVERNTDGAATLSVVVQWFTAKGTSNGSFTFPTPSAPAANTWKRFAARVAPPAGTRYAQIQLINSLSSGHVIYIGYVRFHEVRTPEPWNLVGAAGQPAFSANFANFGGGFAVAAFYKDLNGAVRVKFVISTTAAQVASANIFTLPAGYRPLENHWFQGRINTGGAEALGYFTISSAGAVSCGIALANGATIALDCTFLGEQ